MIRRARPDSGWPLVYRAPAIRCLDPNAPFRVRKRWSQPHLFGEASDPVKPEEDRLGLVAAGCLLFTRRVFRFFRRFAEPRMIPAFIPRIAQALGADEDPVWEEFVRYTRRLDEPWQA
jgi:hypothetical protein